MEVFHAALEESGLGGVSLCPLQGAAGDLNCDLWEPEFCCYFSWNCGFCRGRGEGARAVRGQSESDISLGLIKINSAIKERQSE